MLLRRCDSPLLLAATGRAIDLAEARGWSAATLTGVFYGLKAVLEGHSGNEPVPLTQIRQRVQSRRHSSATRIAEVLAEMELLHDDSTAAIRSWIGRSTSELPAGFGRDIHAWLVVLLDGDARTRLRSPATVRVHFGIVRPFIEHWAATRGHLREITSGDVDTVLEPLRGHRRYNAITALRSLFRFAKRRGLTFADPTRHLSGGRATGRTVLPMTAEEIQAVRAGGRHSRPAPGHRTSSRARRPPQGHPRTHPGRHRPAQQAHHHRRSPAAASASSPATPCWPGSDTGVPPGRTPPTGTSWSRASAPWAPDRSPPTTSTSTSCAASPSNTSGATASCTKPWPPAPTLSTLPWSSTSTTPTRWPTPTPPATFSAAQPNRHCHPARNRHESTPSTRAGADGGRYGR